MMASERNIAAYCDVDGTLTDTTIVTPLVWMKNHCLPPPLNWLWLASLLVRGPWWWMLDQFSRSASNRAIYSNYRGVTVATVRNMAGEYYQDRIRPKLFSGAANWLKKLEAEQGRLVLVTGGLDLFMEPMAQDLKAECLAPSLEARNGAFTGRLTSEPFTGDRKAAAVRRHAAQHRVALEDSYALGDAIGDLPMLECVGRPIAVNPDRRLAAVARQRGWKVEQWK